MYAALIDIVMYFNNKTNTTINRSVGLIVNLNIIIPFLPQEAAKYVTDLEIYCCSSIKSVAVTATTNVGAIVNLFVICISKL